MKVLYVSSEPSDEIEGSTWSELAMKGRGVVLVVFVLNCLYQVGRFVASDFQGLNASI